MKKYLLPSALILLLGLGIGVAQNINKALQLSQDATGAFGVDSTLGVYFPGHVLSPTGGQRPGPSVTGTGTPTIAGTDTSATVTMGASSTTASAVFGTPYLSVPSCVVTWPSTLASEIYVLATTSIGITQTSTSGNKINYWCSGPN